MLNQKHAIAAALLATSCASHASVVTGVTASTNLGTNFGSNITHITDGTGLSSYSLSATHNAGTTGNAWVGRSTVGTIDFNLHGSYALTTLAVWNLNANFPSYGIKALTISSSIDGITYTSLAGAPTVFAMGASNTSELAEIFSLGVATTASYVRFSVASNYGGAAAAMSEVMFDTTPIATTVPEPASLALVGFTLQPHNLAVSASSRRKSMRNSRRSTKEISRRRRRFVVTWPSTGWSRLAFWTRPPRPMPKAKRSGSCQRRRAAGRRGRWIWR